MILLILCFDFYSLATTRLVYERKLARIQQDTPAGTKKDFYLFDFYHFLIKLSMYLLKR